MYANKCKIRKKNLYFSAQGHCFQCQSNPVYDFLLVINYNLGPISHRLRDIIIIIIIRYIRQDAC